MPEARSLKDLLRIREFAKNRKFFRTLHGCLGTAVGYKYAEKEHRFEEKDGEKIPAILVFVKEKIPRAALRPDCIVPDRLTGPDGLVCAADVMVGEAPDRPVDMPGLSGDNAILQHELHDRDLGVVGGIPIQAPGTMGTAACVVRFRAREKNKSREALGVLTNFHVAGLEGTRMVKLGGRVLPLGRTIFSQPIAGETATDNDLEGYLKPKEHRIDVGLIEITNRRLKVKAGVHGLDKLGKPFALDLNSMEPIGRSVVGVGQTLGRQEGLIMAFGYEWRNDLETDSWCATDYLILSSTGQPFAAPGDSGKLVVTNEEKPRPIALLWGGERHDFWNIQAQASCAYATDIGLALHLLQAEIL